MDSEKVFPETYREFASKNQDNLKSPCRVEFGCPRALKDKNTCCEGCGPLAFYRATMPEVGWIGASKAIDFEEGYDVTVDRRSYFETPFKAWVSVASGNLM